MSCTLRKWLAPSESKTELLYREAIRKPAWALYGPSVLLVPVPPRVHPIPAHYSRLQTEPRN